MLIATPTTKTVQKKIKH